MAEPLVVQFVVRAPIAHAFNMWTARCSLWWPRSHTISGDPAAIVFEPRPGGRIFERGQDGTENTWGQVLDWEPPRRLSYRWHLFFDAAEATDVEVTFTESDGTTAVRLNQSGWERLGPAGPPRRTRTGRAWATISGLYAESCATTYGPLSAVQQGAELGPDLIP
ncbi:MAG: SRPBCC domain-containing protein [Geodermatophilaceae bacterium]